MKVFLKKKIMMIECFQVTRDMQLPRIKLYDRHLNCKFNLDETQQYM